MNKFINDLLAVGLYDINKDLSIAVYKGEISRHTMKKILSGRKDLILRLLYQGEFNVLIDKLAIPKRIIKQY